MLTLSVPSKKIKLWKNKDAVSGEVSVEANLQNPNAPLPPGDNPIVKTSFQVQGGSKLELGTAGAVSLGVKAGASAILVPIWQKHTAAAGSLVSQYDLAGSLTPKNMLLALAVGTEAGVSAEGSFQYSVLSAGATLEAGVDAGYVQVKSYGRNEKFGSVIEDFFSNLQVPSTITEPPAKGEVVAFEYGGYLNFGINASAGYEIKGTKAISIRDLKLSEHYQLGIVGKLGLTGSVAGRYSVEVRQGDDPDWARVIVRRKQSKEMAFAADVSVDGELQSEGLPQSGKEFLGAILGVNAKNWINMIDGFVDKAGNLSSIDDIKKRVDGLAGDFIEEWVGKAVDELPPGAEDFLGRVQKVVNSYRQLENNAVSLFDRYFDPLADRTEELTGHLLKLKKMTSWDQLEGEVNPMLWNIVRQLTDGDPLGWALGKVDLPGVGSVPSLVELKKRVDSTLSLIQDDAHEEIRRVIRLAKEQFHLDHLMDGLEQVSSSTNLKNLASSKLKHFASRLIGQELDKLENSKEIKKAAADIQEIVSMRDDFWKTFDEKLKDAAKQTFSLKLHAEYRRASERDALVDIDIRLKEKGQALPTGQQLMESAGRGDFRKILAQYQPKFVRLREGVLTHRITRESAFKFNIVGWHLNHSYESIHKLMVASKQQIVASENGQITVFTTLDMGVDSEKRHNRGTRNAEAVQTNFMLRFLGETRNVIRGSDFNEKDRQYAIEVITGRSAEYGVTFTDENTDPAELDDYLAFAKELGLDKVGATKEGLAPVLTLKDDTYGKIEANYNVRFTPEGIDALFTGGATVKQIRLLLRRIVMANYYGDGNIAESAWLYCSDKARELEKGNPNFVFTDSILGAAFPLSVTTPIPGLKPSNIRNTRENRFLVSVLFDIERDIISAFQELKKLLNSKTKVQLKDYEERLKDFGSALTKFDKIDRGENTVFAVFDGLIRLHSKAAEARASSLEFTAERDSQKRMVVFTLQAKAPQSAKEAGATG